MPFVNTKIYEEEGEGAPDGMKIDSTGNVYCGGAGGIHVFGPDATCLGMIHVRERTVNFAWGDRDDRSLYITASTSVYRIRVRVPGFPAWRRPRHLTGCGKSLRRLEQPTCEAAPDGARATRSARRGVTGRERERAAPSGTGRAVLPHVDVARAACQGDINDDADSDPAAGIRAHVAAGRPRPEDHQGRHAHAAVGTAGAVR